MAIDKNKIIKTTNILILVFLGIHAMGSQLSVALSSIGLGGIILLSVFRIILDKDYFKPEKLLIYVFLLYIFAHIIASIVSIDPLDSFEQSKRVLLFSGIFVTIMFFTELKQLRYFLAVFFIITALVSFYELIRYFIDFFSQNEVPIGEYRIGFFGYPITNGEIKMLVILMIFPFLLTRENFVMKKRWLLIILVPILLSLFFTNSRNAMLGVFVGLLYIGFVKNKYFMGAIILLTALFFLFAPYQIKERLMSITDLSQRSTLGRFETWKTGLRMIEDHPVFGIGDTDILKLYRTYKQPEYQGEGSHMHNNVLNVTLTLGVFGLLCWLALMYYLIYRLTKIYYLTKKEPLFSTLAVISIACFIAFQVSGLTEWNFGDFEFTAVLWFSLGLAFLSEKFHKAKQRVA